MCRFLLLFMLAAMTACFLLPDAAIAGDEGSSTEAELRRQLADLRVQLRRTQRELEELQEFLAESDPQQKVQQLREEKRAIDAQQQAMERQREELDAARKRLLNATLEKRRKPTPGIENASKPKQELQYTLSYIRTGPDREVTYIEFGNLIVPANSTPNIDRTRVRIRGTLQNASDELLRFTFEARVADSRNRLLGRWRYQTPLLEPLELHEFEFEVPVTDALRVAAYQIGDIRSDGPRPLKEEKDDAKEGKEILENKNGARERKNAENGIE